MKTVDDLLKELKSLEIIKRCLDGSTYKSEVVSPDGFYLVEKLIREFLLDQHDSKIGEMQGKIFAYEEIIKKSNFAPFVEVSDNVAYSQNVISRYDIEDVKKSLEETKETTEEETMFYSEFRESDDWQNADFIEYFDLSGNVIETPKKSDKILKYYKREVGNFKFMIAFIEKQRKGE